MIVLFWCKNIVLWCLAFTYILNLFLSLCVARAVAQNKTALQKLGITHVLNAAHSKQGSIGNQSFYGNSFVYCGIPADDSTHFDLDVYFQPAADFIHKALKSPDGKTPQGFFFSHESSYFCTVRFNCCKNVVVFLKFCTSHLLFHPINP